VIQTIREKQPAYNLITNNCQTYALQLLDAIKANGDNEFGTTLAIYERILGPGKVADLFVTDTEDEAGQEHAFAPPGRQDTVVFAQQVMNDNTTQLDTEEELKKTKKKKKGGNLFSVFTRK
jgi:hypothetical protein